MGGAEAEVGEGRFGVADAEECVYGCVGEGEAAVFGVS